MPLTPEHVATALGGIEYSSRLPKELLEEAKAAGIVIVMGKSDDLMGFYGAIYDEVGAYDGGTALVDKEGLLPDRDNIENDDELERFFARKKKAVKVDAVWDPGDGLSWLIKTEIPHETFNVMEDGEVFCQGVVFSLSEVVAG